MEMNQPKCLNCAKIFKPMNKFHKICLECNDKRKQKLENLQNYQNNNLKKKIRQKRCKKCLNPIPIHMILQHQRECKYLKCNKCQSYISQETFEEHKR